MRILLADDHHLVRAGIRALLDETGGVQVVGEATTGQEAVELAERLRPDILLMDINMPRLNGLQAIEQLHAACPEVRIVVLSMHSDATVVRQALQSGARGYLLKSSLASELTLAIRAAERGEMYISPMVAEPLVLNALRRPDTEEDGQGAVNLSPREREVLQLIAEGKTTAEIATTLVISVKTAEKHRASLMNKLGVHDAVNLMRLAVKQRLVFLED